jgi:hypothetical protein
LGAVAILAVIFAVAALLGLFSRDGENSATGTTPSALTTPSASGTPSSGAGGQTEPTDTARPPDADEAPPEASSEPTTTPDDADESEPDASPAESSDASGTPAEEGDYCTYLDQSEEALSGIMTDPNDISGMAETVGAYVEALTRARDAAPEEIRADLDVILEYWEPLLEAARNPLSAAGGLDSTRTAEEYADAMANLYAHKMTQCTEEGE